MIATGFPALVRRARKACLPVVPSSLLAEPAVAQGRFRAKPANELREENATNRRT